MVFHVKSTFPLESFDWLILAKNVIVNTGREVAGDIFTQTFTFSIVVNAEMAPGFHILVYTKTDQANTLVTVCMWWHIGNAPDC